MFGKINLGDFEMIKPNTYYIKLTGFHFSQSVENSVLKGIFYPNMSWYVGP